MATRADGDRPALVLASGSPRRRELLARLGIDPLVVAIDVDESPCPGEGSAGLVERLARAKAAAGWDQRHRLGLAGSEPTLLVAADTVVHLDGWIMGKPADRAEATAMLRALSGRCHEVYTGLAVITNASLTAADGSQRPTVVTGVERTVVRFHPLDDADIAWYVATGEPLDKAGAYGIQGRGALLVERLEGSYANVVGLPVSALDRLLRRVGHPLRSLDGVAAHELEAADGLSGRLPATLGSDGP